VTQWLAARARNALRRPLRIIGVSSTAFIAALLTLILIPHEATRRAERLLDETRNRPDTVAMLRRINQLRLETTDAEHALARDRVRRLAHEQAVRESLLAWHGYPEGATRRDSLVADRVELAALLARANRSPLPTSYRGLGAARALGRDRRVRSLLDSLAVLARSRDAISSGGQADPVYLALTARLTSIGRTIQTIAAARLAALDADIAKLPPPSPSRAVDTMPARMRVDSVRRVAARAAGALAGARRLDVTLDVQAERARALAAGNAPPLALMAAALVLGLAVGFAVTFGGELATPRVSDAREASRVAGVSTLATVVPRAPDPQRMRRKTDRDVSTLIDVNSESYRYVYLSVSGHDAAAALGFPLVAVTGDEAEVVGTVATNIAVASAHDSRTTLLIDADTEASVVAGILGVRRAPGVSDVLRGVADWSGIVVTAVVGRDQMLNVMPAGTVQDPSTEVPGAGEDPGPTAPVDDPTVEGAGAPWSAEAQELCAELIRLGRRYDLVVVAAPAGAAQVGPDSILPVRDALVCARVAYTPLSRLAAAVATLRESRLRVRGIVLWDADVPPRLTES
jgi:Mrp family chromosome partitioning ATPase